MAALHQLSFRDWELLRLSTDDISLDVVPGLGGTVVSLRRQADDCEILWQTPWGLRMRGARSVPGNSEALMIDTFPGGWQSLFPNGGETAIVAGVEWGFDGEARLTPMEWEQAGTSVIMKGRLVRSPFELTKIISMSGAEVTMGETIKNVGGEAVEVMWGNQIILGPPLIGPRSVVDTTATTVHPDPKVASGSSYEDVMPWPRSYGSNSVINLRSLPGPRDSESRMAYLSDFGRPTVTVTNSALDLAVDLEWDDQAWPHLWYSLEAGHRSGFPWFGAGYFLSLTPSTSWPGHGFHDARRVAQTTVWVQPDEARTAHLTVRLRSAGPV